MALGSTRSNINIKGAPQYDSAGFWDARFAEGRDVGEWLNSGERVIEIVMTELKDKLGKKEQPRVLHLGPGVSRLGEKLRDAFVQNQWTGSSIVNVDFSSEAVRLGQAAEKCQEPQNAMHWHCADLLQWESISALSTLAPFRLILDKSTSDAIATASDRHFDVEDDTSCICPTVKEGLREKSPLTLSPTELLALHLVPLTEKGSTWVALSYSTFRFDNLASISKYWNVRSRIALKAPSGTVSETAYTPDVFHWIYILDRI